MSSFRLINCLRLPDSKQVCQSPKRMSVNANSCVMWQNIPRFFDFWCRILGVSMPGPPFWTQRKPGGKIESKPAVQIICNGYRKGHMGNEKRMEGSHWQRTMMAKWRDSYLWGWAQVNSSLERSMNETSSKQMVKNKYHRSHDVFRKFSCCNEYEEKSTFENCIAQTSENKPASRGRKHSSIIGSANKWY